MKLKNTLLALAVMVTVSTAEAEKPNINESLESSRCQKNVKEGCLKMGLSYLNKIQGDKKERKINYFIGLRFLKKGCMLGSGESCRFASAYYNPEAEGDMEREEGVRFYANKGCQEKDEQSCKMIKDREKLIEAATVE